MKIDEERKKIIRLKSAIRQLEFSLTEIKDLVVDLENANLDKEEEGWMRIGQTTLKAMVR
jgi:hypothetical protein